MHFRLMEGLRREESKREELVCCQDGFSVELWVLFGTAPFISFPLEVEGDMKKCKQVSGVSRAILSSAAFF